mmetsp:Transcript_19708/g.30426  ORF Transcript_19708/g.30426 Transcript_19708/m.30426 type:complete len:123 (+) Transcript_19708:473-841(+)
MTGKLGVGSKRFWAKQLNNMVIVSYPISPTVHRQKVEEEKDLLIWNQFGRMQTLSMSKVLSWANDTEKKFPESKVFNHIRVPSVFNAKFDLLEEFKEKQGGKLVPIIFSHGMCTNQSTYSGV